MRAWISKECSKKLKEHGYDTIENGEDCYFEAKTEEHYLEILSEVFEGNVRISGVPINEYLERKCRRSLTESELNSLGMYLGITSKEETLEVINKLELPDDIKEQIYEDLVSIFKKTRL